MEPLDSDFDYTPRVPRPSTPASRLSTLLIFPVIGLLILLVLIGSVIFQWDLSGLIDGLVGFMILCFIAFIAILFWAFAPRPQQQE
jgi:uncharacterized membrane protein YccC